MKVVYAKYARNRKSEYKISTEICKYMDHKVVIKRALNHCSAHHLQTVYENYFILCDIYGADHIAHCRKLDNFTLEFDYIDGITVSQAINDAICANNSERINELLDMYLYEILEKNFNGVGKLDDVSVDMKHPDLCNRKYNIDLIFDNVILTANDFVLIDYEWLYPVLPSEYIKERALIAFCEKHSELHNKLKDIPAFKTVLENGFSKQYKIMELNFHDSILTDGYSQYMKNTKNIFHTIDEIKEQCESLTNKNHMLSKKIISNHNVIMEKEAIVESKIREIESLSQQMELTNRELDSTRNQLKLLLDSRSWRITAPLRWIVAKLKN